MRTEMAGAATGSVFFRPVEVIASGKVCVFLQMFGTQGFRNRVFAAEPFAEVNQLAAVRTKRRMLAVQPVPSLFARWTFRLHGGPQSQFDFRQRSLYVGGHRCGVLGLCPGLLENLLDVGNVGLGLEAGQF